MDPKVDVWFPPALQFFVADKLRYKVAFGGRGSGKSWAIADFLLLLASAETKRILCAREFQRSITDSVHHLLSSQIDRLGLSGKYEIQRASIMCRATGSEFIFAGLKHNVASLKSLEGIDICWVEEAESVSDNSWSVLIPTIRKPGSEIWMTFNPSQETDPTYQRFIVNPPPGCKSAKINWQDNPCLPDVLRAEAEHLRRTDPDAYHHVWEGGTWARSDSQVFNGKWMVDDFTSAPEWDGPYFGADWGFSTDPTVLLKMWIHDGKLYVENEAYGVGVDIVDTPRLFDMVPGSRKYVVRADCARPETINHVRGAGFRCEAAEKWAGSVEDGIQFLRGFEKVVIHPRCRHMAEEARLYSYKTDRLTGDVLPDLKPGHDHCWDAVRYGLQPMIRKRTAPAFTRSTGLYSPRR